MHQSAELDYEGVPFRCRRCHKVGHLIRDCPLIKKSEDSPRITPAPSRMASLTISRPVSTGLNPTVSSPAVDPGLRHPTPPRTRARTVAETGTVSGTPLFPSHSNNVYVMHDSGTSIHSSMVQCAITSPPLASITGPSIIPSSVPPAPPCTSTDVSPPPPILPSF